MSRREKKDYKKILKIAKRAVPGLKLERVIVDFEAAIWKAIYSVFPDVAIQGCSFHWTQAVWRKVQHLGLQVPYMENGPVHDYIRELMALPFLPEEHIKASFNILAEKATPGLQDLLDYIRSTWLDSSVWPPSTWSVYNKSVHTNNDVEGWHRRINAKAGRSHLQLYVLIPFIYREARLVSIQVRLVKEGKLRRYQQKQYKRIQGKLFNLWEKYEQREISTSKLLRACSKINGPGL
ncbi:uncharacterized protein LOC102808349 [Saccoglossus kowalevskii]|uniref:Uncharacterized protein LOC102808349 n=1 Tax=Saccoglossus kowalevskii TaxID=10224 RepID=A0ABM0MJJ5_SACKO|nr:PREDICTED: uncharacterized protein LOC102808349 [Saccoglossus kowalevskii]